MTPLAESREADDTFGPFLLHDDDLMDQLVDLGGQVETLVPDCVGMSLTLLDEGPTFALSSDAAGAAGSTPADDVVATSLCFPVVDHGRRVADFVLYAATVGAFSGLHERLATILGAVPEGAAADTDLGLAGLALARRTPVLLRQSTSLAVAASLVGAVHGRGVEHAEGCLRHAAVRAGLPLALVVDIVVDVLLEA